MRGEAGEHRAWESDGHPAIQREEVKERSVLIYLAGPIDSGPSSAEIKAEIEAEIGKWTKANGNNDFILFDPETAYRVPTYKFGPGKSRRLVEINKVVLHNCDAVIAINPHRSLGTGREVQMALSVGKAVHFLFTVGRVPDTPYLHDRNARTTIHMTVPGLVGGFMQSTEYKKERDARN